MTGAENNPHGAAENGQDATPAEVQAQPERPQQVQQVRSLGHPLDTVSSATREMLEGRGGGLDLGEGPAAVFKVIAIVAIAVLVAAIAATQLGAFGS